jgi:hypothetical protein
MLRMPRTLAADRTEGAYQSFGHLKQVCRAQAWARCSIGSEMSHVAA